MADDHITALDDDTVDLDEEPTDGESTPEGETPTLRRVRRSTGRRTQQRRRRMRRRVMRTTLLVVLLIVVGIVAVPAVITLLDHEDASTEGPDTAAPDGAEETDAQPTLVLATTASDDGSGPADLISILSLDRSANEGTVLFVPATLLVDVPGHGLQPLGDALAFGGAPLLEATLDNFLGVDLDGVAVVTPAGLSSLFTRVGGLTVDLGQQIIGEGPDGSRSVRFQPGEQYLDGPRLAELMTIEQQGESQLERLPRVQLLLDALLHQLDDEAVAEELFVDGAPMLSTSMDDQTIRELFEGLAALTPGGGVVYRTLPVQPLGAASDDSYRPDADRLRTLIEERFGPSSTAGNSEGRSLQILNGNGVPGIGQDVAQRLIPAGFRVVLTGNADSFTHEETLIVVYDSDPEQVAIAEQIRELLGVGTVELSPTPQSVVDITIVVGADFEASA